MLQLRRCMLPASGGHFLQLSPVRGIARTSGFALLSSFGVSPDRLPVPATAAPPNKSAPARAKTGPSSTIAASMIGTTNPPIRRSPVEFWMFDAPFHDAKVIVKAFVGRSAWARYPCTRRRFLVKLRCMCLDPKKRGDVLVGLDAEPSSCDVCIPEAQGQRAVVDQFRVRFGEILPGAFDISARIDLGKAGDLLACQLKHAGALPLVFHSLRRAS